ncbi:MAG: hypothetical protein HY302_13795 [Opitutae bacterium]|nr:hypothetical protein [Opitutae bacterium]
MDLLPGFIEIPLRLALLLAGLLVPGSLLLRALRLPWSLAASFAGSFVALYATVLLCVFLKVPIMFATLTGGLVLICVGLLQIHLRQRPGPPALDPVGSFAPFTQLGRWTPLYLLFWAVVGYRLVDQPLTGPDAVFRWSFLAEQMLHLGSLDFYPPQTAAQFTHYFWPESIPPGIASLYAWAYACGGSKHALWTSPVVAVQLLAMHELVWRLAHRWGGEVAARRALLLAAATPLLTWSTLIGQETALMSVGVGGFAWCLLQQNERSATRWAALAGGFAVAAGAAREYGLAFPLLALAAARLLAVPRRSLVTLAAVALPLAFVWPLRTWALTGNPFYSLDLGGLLPGNAVFAEWIAHTRSLHGSGLFTSTELLSVARYLTLWALPALIGTAAVGRFFHGLREARLVALLASVVGALWLASVPFTAGGLFYSLRVLSPAFLLLVAFGGYALWVVETTPLGRKLCAGALALLLLESLPKTLVLPENPYRTPPGNWLAAGRNFSDSVRAHEQELVAKLATLPDHQRLLSESAGLPRLLAPHGITVVPIWSPEAAWLFDRSLKPEELARRAIRSRLHYLVLQKSGLGFDFLNRRARWQVPWFKIAPVLETDTYAVFELTVTPPP